MIQLHHGDCLEVLKSLPDNSIDSIVTDPPYGLAFMNKKWDYDVPSVDIWKECLRVLKPGGHVLSFGGTRTYHRMVVNMEDAGFEIRDQIQWLYGSGFPKSLNISKAIDKAAGVEREVIGVKSYPREGTTPVTRKATSMMSQGGGENVGQNSNLLTAPATDLAKQWDGWGTALKPSNEPICLARKPISESTVAANVVKWGTGGINIDECRISFESGGTPSSNPSLRRNEGAAYRGSSMFQAGGVNRVARSSGRWPANTLFDEEAAQMLDEQSGITSRKDLRAECKTKGMGAGLYEGGVIEKASRVPDYGGGASRFFYVAKAPPSERKDSTHPTQKPIKLMQYLIKLITPPNGTVLDPFAGSGTTGVAAKQLNFNFIGIEREQEYLEIAQRRTA